MTRATVISAGLAMLAVGAGLAFLADSVDLVQAGITCLVLGAGCTLGGILSRRGDR